MTETFLDEKLQTETDNLKNLQVSDINSRRLVSNYAAYINKNFELLAGIEDSQELLSRVVSLLRGSPKILEDISHELNATRREQASRVQAVSDCRDILIETIEVQAREAERVKEVADKIREDGNVERRKIGDRPIKLKEIRKAQELITEEDSEAEEEDESSALEDELEEQKSTFLI